MIQIIVDENSRKTITIKKRDLCWCPGISGKKDSPHKSKWPRVARIMRIKRISVLATQEARKMETYAM